MKVFLLLFFIVLAKAELKPIGDNCDIYADEHNTLIVGTKAIVGTFYNHCQVEDVRNDIESHYLSIQCYHDVGLVFESTLLHERPYRVKPCQMALVAHLAENFQKRISQEK